MARLFFLIIVFSLNAWAQSNVIKETLLSSSDKNLKFGDHIEITNISNSGLITRLNYHFIKYNDALEKEWEIDIPKANTYKIGGYRGEILGNQEGIFFYEYEPYNLLKSAPKSFWISFFDPKGKSIHKEHKISTRYDGISCAFINTRGLNILVYTVSETNLTYDLITFEKQSLNMTTRELKLKSATVESEVYNKAREMYIGWKLLSRQDNKTILVKSYFVPDLIKSYSVMNTENTKKIVLQTVEIADDGTLQNFKEFPTRFNTEGSCNMPQMFFDAQKDEVYAIETYRIKQNTHAGIYLLKYKYSTAENIDNTTTTVDKVLFVYYQDVPSPFLGDIYKHYVVFNSPHRIVYNSVSGTFDFWNMHSAAGTTIRYIWLRFDDKGECLASATLNLRPTKGLSRETLWNIPYKVSDMDVKHPPLKVSPIDLTFKLSEKEEAQNMGYAIIEKASQYIVVTTLEKNAEIRAYVIPK